MGAHPDAYVRLAGILRKICTARRTRTPGTPEYTVLTDAMNKYLDEWYTYRYLATEWDAQHWGFPDTWMSKERRRMNDRAMPMTKGLDGRWYAIQQ